VLSLLSTLYNQYLFLVSALETVDSILVIYSSGLGHGQRGLGLGSKGL